MNHITHIINHYTDFTAFLLLGALVHSITQSREAKLNCVQFGYIDFLGVGIISVFTGIMFAIASVLTSDDELVMYFTSGVGLYLGFKGMNKLADMMLYKFTRKLPDDNG